MFHCLFSIANVANIIDNKQLNSTILFSYNGTLMGEDLEYAPSICPAMPTNI